MPDGNIVTLLEKYMALTLTKQARIGLALLVVGAAGGTLAWKQMNKAPQDQTKVQAASQQRGGVETSGGNAQNGGNFANLGSASQPLKVSLVSFHGYAPALLANGKSLETQANSIFAKEGVNVNLMVQDDMPTTTDLFEKGLAQCAWRTSDFWAQEQPNLRNAKHDGAAVMVVDNTQGGDAIIATNPNIRSVEDLAGKKVALLQFTPSHGMTRNAIENSAMTARQKQSVKLVYIQPQEGTGGVRAALEANAVDAVALWDPDLSLAMRVPGAHVVYSTKTATNLIYDVMVCDRRVLSDPQGAQAVQKFVNGWMKGVEAARRSPDDALDALVKTEPMFDALAKKEGNEFVKGLFKNVVWTSIEDNARILGLSGGTNHYERVYAEFDRIYRAEGALANPNSPVIPPQESFDYRFIKNMIANVEREKGVGSVERQAQLNEPKFSQKELDVAVRDNVKSITKPVQINFATGSSELSKRAQETLDREMVPMIENNGQAYFEISGNTDAVGSDTTNLPLSKARAIAVRNYLVKQWEFPASRFHVVGNGSSKPLCNEEDPQSAGLTLEDCRALNRTTRIAVYGQ